MKHYKTSISKRLFKYILFIVLAFALVVMLSNTLLLRPLYRFYMQQELKESLDEIMALDFSDDDDEWLSEIEEVEEGGTFEVLIYDGLRLIYSSNEESKWMGSQRGKHHNEIIVRIREDGDDPEEVLEEVRKRGGVQDVLYQTGEKDGYTIIITQVMDVIDSTIMQTNLVVGSVTLLFLAVTLVLAFALSRKFTRPIQRMQATVDNMTKLKFDETCNVSTGDELERLADDINALSARLKHTLEELNARNLQLEKDILSQRQFISNASHELRTPLSLIKGYADEMANGFITDKTQQRLVFGIIGEEAGKMNRLLKEMLDLSRMESGRMQLNLQPISARDEIHAFVEKYSGYIGEKGLDVSLDLAEGNDTCLVDPMRFEQVMANYLSNAAKYGDAKHRVVISTEIKQDVIRIAVFNSGPSISEDALNRLWDRFYKQDESRTQDDGSYGLGLSIVAAIQNLSGQAFGAENTDGGVVFWFEAAKA
ncbi:MAG: HAMP domain-containing sensor histidine kinase [Eubacteriales bacterium]